MTYKNGLNTKKMVKTVILSTLNLLHSNCNSEAYDNDNKPMMMEYNLKYLSKINNFKLSFYARQHICYSAYKPWQFRPSVCPSVCLSVTRVDQSKTVEARITQFSPYSSPIPLVFRG